MSTTIDQKVVEMQFDNRRFESNVSTTLSTLDKLKQSLNLTGAAKGLEDVSAAAKTVNMSALGGAVESVSLKFSALQTMAVTALANITNSAVNTGKRIVSALTIDPIKTGFQEYETQINAVQTILANTSSKGTTLNDVNAALDELNTYADKTIYNFTEMTRNIGTFTAAGVDLDTSVNAIQGIANLAAVSGSTSQQASTAMYQLSQALAAGKVQLMDWNSVVNAGMGGEMFQNALKETSRLLGTGADEAIKAKGSFRESLRLGWLTSEVLTETLKKFTTTGANARVAEYTKLSVEAVEAALKSAEAQYGEADAIEYASKALAKKSGKSAEEIKKTLEFAKTAEDAATKVKTFSQLWDTLKESAQSGWTSTWELVVGDFEEAKVLFTEVSDTIGKMISDSANARNELLAGALQKTSATDYISKLTGGTKESVQQLIEMGEATGYTSAEFKKLASTLAKNDPNMRAVITNLVKMSSGEKDVVKYIADISGMSEKSIKELQKLGKETGYTSKEFKDLARSLSEGDRKMEMTITNLLKMSDEMSKLSGRELLIDSLRNVFNGLLDVITPVKEAFREIFPAMTSKQLYSIIEGIHELTEKFKLSETTSNNLKRTFKGLFAVLDIIKEGVFAVGKVLFPLIGGFGDLGGGILSVTASIGDWLVNFRDMIKETDIFNVALQNIVKFVKLVVDEIKKFAGAINDAFIAPGLEVLSALLERFHGRMSQVKDAAKDMGSGVEIAVGAMGKALENSDFMKMMQALGSGIKKLGKGLIDAFGALTEGLAEKIADFDFKGLLDTFNTGVFGAILLAMNKFAKNINKPFDSLSDTLEGVTGILEGVMGCLKAYQNQLQAQTLMKIATAIGILAASIMVISLIDSEKLSVALGSITVLFADLMTSMMLFGKIGTIKGVMKSCTTMLSMSTSVLILAIALKQIGDLDFKQMATGLVGVIGLTGTMVAAAKIMGSGGKTVIKGATQMVIFAAAIKVLVSACEDLSALDWNELAKGLVGVGVLMSELALFTRVGKFDGGMMSTATGVVILAAGMKVLASACADFAGMDWGELGKGLTSIGILLLEVAAFTKLTGNAKNVISTSTALVILGGAMKIFASAVKDFGAMNWGELGRGLSGMAGALLAVTVALRLMPKNMVSMGVGMIAVSTSMIIMAEALDRMGGMTWEEIGKGLATLGGSIVILALGLRAMTGTLAGSAAMLVAVASLGLLTPILMALGSMSWDSILRGLTALAGTFAVIGIAGALLTPVVGTVISFAAAIALIGVGVAAVGAGLLAAGAGISAVAVGITALAASVAGGATAIVAALTAIIMGVISLIPAILEKLGEGIVALAGVIADGAPAIGEAVKALVLTIVDVLVECVPAIANGALELIKGVLEAMVKYIPDIVNLLYDLVIKILETLRTKVPELIKVAVSYIAEFFSGIIDALKGIDTDTLVKAIAGIGLLSGMMLALSAVAGLVPSAMVGVLAVGVLIAELALVLAAIGGLAQIPGLDWLISEGGQFLELIGAAIGGFIGSVVGGFMGGITGQLPDIGKDLSDFMTNAKPFIEGSQNIDSGALEGVKTLAEMILLLTGASILEGLTSWLTGGSSLTSFGADIAAFGPNIKAFADSIAGIDGGAVTAAANAAKALAEMSNIIPNEGGLKAWFTGDNSLSKFGDDIVAFGSSLKAYSFAVMGIDPIAVTASATAAKALADLANTVPNEGGMKAWFTGESSLSKFGADIVGFGQHLKAYSLAVVGIDPTMVTASTNAAKCLADLANHVPNEGGVKAWFTGENSIASFGDKIVSFGQDFAAYALSISGVNPTVVTATSNAAQSIVTLANSLPEDKLFKNETTLNEFGSQLSAFGSHFASYYAYICTINSTSLAATTTELWKLVRLFEGMIGLDTSGASGFAKALGKLAKSGIENFIDTFKTAGYGATQTIKDFFDALVNTVNNYQQNFLVSGKTVMVGFISGVELKKMTVRTTFVTMINEILDLINNNQQNFFISGKTIMVGLINGVELKKIILISTVTTMMNDVVAKLDRYVDFYNAGKSCVQGFANGITDNTFMAEAKAAAMAQAAYQAAMAALKINSPSKIFRAGARSIPEGFAMGIVDKTQMVKESAEAMAYAALDTTTNVISRLADMISSDIDANPTIRPILDLSDVESGTSKLSGLLSRNQAVSISNGMNRAASAGEIQNGDPKSSSGNNYNFIQNNYSPKSLSRVEIYRQSKNQFSAFERRLKNA